MKGRHLSQCMINYACKILISLKSIEKGLFSLFLFSFFILFFLSVHITAFLLYTFHKMNNNNNINLLIQASYPPWSSSLTTTDQTNKLASMSLSVRWTISITTTSMKKTLLPISSKVTKIIKTWS